MQSQWSALPIPQGALKPGWPFRDVRDGGKGAGPLYPCRDHSLATGSREYLGEVVLSRASPPGGWAISRGPGREIWATLQHPLCTLDFSLPAHAHVFLGQAHP